MKSLTGRLMAAIGWLGANGPRPDPEPLPPIEMLDGAFCAVGAWDGESTGAFIELYAIHTRQSLDRVVECGRRRLLEDSDRRAI